VYVFVCDGGGGGGGGGEKDTLAGLYVSHKLAVRAPAQSAKCFETIRQLKGPDFLKGSAPREKEDD